VSDHSGRIFLVGHDQDEHCDYLEGVLAPRGCAIVRLSIDSLSSAGFSWTPDCLERVNGSERVPLVGAGLWRRPGHAMVQDYDARYADFVLAECHDAFVGAMLSGKIRWVNHPIWMEQAELKLLQIAQARALGLRVPDTIVTNSSTDACAFADGFESVVAKAVRYALVSESDPPLMAWTAEVSKNELGQLEGAPIILQRRIRGREHLRVITVGAMTFAARLIAEEIDWRSSLKNHEAFEPTDTGLSRSVSNQAQAIASALGLRFSAQDWIVDEDGEPVFLEANPNGQWLFLERQFDGAIGEALADLLCRLVRDVE
jgi:glutathione synthase/RimK-type ligase-like ATP-grasp enzyme